MSNQENQSATIQPGKLLLELKEVRAVTGLSTTTIYKYVREGIFPKPKRIGSRAVRWRLADIEAYVNS